MANELLAFGVDLEDVRERLSSLKYFTTVERLQDFVLDIEEGVSGTPPLAYVSVASETAEPNKLSGGPDAWSQRVTVTVSVLFCIPASRADEKPMDDVEDARKAVVRMLLAWTPKGAESPFQFARFLLRDSRDGLIWSEVLMRTSYHLRRT